MSVQPLQGTLEVAVALGSQMVVVGPGHPQVFTTRVVVVVPEGSQQRIGPWAELLGKSEGKRETEIAKRGWKVGEEGTHAVRKRESETGMRLKKRIANCFLGSFSTSACIMGFPETFSRGLVMWSGLWRIVSLLNLFLCLRGLADFVGASSLVGSSSKRVSCPETMRYHSSS